MNSEKQIRGRTPQWGHVTFRLDPTLHKDLVEAAKILDIDLSSLLKAMIAEAKPGIDARVAEAMRQHHDAFGMMLTTLRHLIRKARRPALGHKYKTTAQQIQELAAQFGIDKEE